MKLLLLTTAPLSADTGPQARLQYELAALSDLASVTIVCLGRSADDEQTRARYPKVDFKHFPIIYRGWEVVNLREIADFIEVEAARGHYAMVILLMEIWDLMRELSGRLESKVPFATTIHAMPFLGSPLEPSGDFARDVKCYADSGLDEYRREYILAHFEETEAVFKKTLILANNNTVAHYFSCYFQALPFWTLGQSVYGTASPPVYNPHPVFDFAYIARIERGKGVEYLSAILEGAAQQLNRKVKLALAGRADDAFGREAIRDLLSRAAAGRCAEVCFYGWADRKMKQAILSDAGVFLYPSYYDNYPTVITEALAYGLPCIVWDVPYTRVNYLRTGALLKVPFPETGHFAETAVRARMQREALFSEAVAYVRQADSGQEIARKDVELFRTLLGRHD